MEQVLINLVAGALGGLGDVGHLCLEALVGEELLGSLDDGLTVPARVGSQSALALCRFCLCDGCHRIANGNLIPYSSKRNRNTCSV